jgi:hypothetical protein
MFTYVPEMNHGVVEDYTAIFVFQKYMHDTRCPVIHIIHLWDSYHWERTMWKGYFMDASYFLRIIFPLVL